MSSSKASFRATFRLWLPLPLEEPLAFFAGEGPLSEADVEVEAEMFPGDILGLSSEPDAADLFIPGRPIGGDPRPIFFKVKLGRPTFA